MHLTAVITPFSNQVVILAVAGSSPVSHPTKNIAPPASVGWGDVRFQGSPVVGTTGTTVPFFPSNQYPVPRRGRPHHRYVNWRHQDEVQETTPAACTSPDNTCGKPHACHHTPLAVMPGEIFSKFIQQGGTNIGNRKSACWHRLTRVEACKNRCGDQARKARYIWEHRAPLFTNTSVRRPATRAILFAG
ncbi:Uncharacterised protein [Mycobacteroides abscessus subsp. massiliense]|nr:Uncharacterised protein [Mycobacteroides abscessus subsp. massiliense]SLI17194.1 Uncharacterised protein [Mycobacteroides abscessus subsp. massiliense]